MAKAKQTQPEPKQIVLTQEQYYELISIYDVINEVTDQISDLANGEFNKIQLGYNLGMINNDLQRAYNTLDELTDAIAPNDNWFNYDNDDEDLDPNK